MSTSEEVRTIPLEEIYASIEQAGMQRLRGGIIPQPDGTRRYAAPYGPDLQQIHPGGASNLFLVHGNDITEAVKATRLVYADGFSTYTPAAPQDGAPAAPLWLFTYFGRGGSVPPSWVIEAVEQRGQTVQVRFRKNVAITRDLRAFMFLVPLGKLAGGTYTLELFDAEKMEVTLLRRVTVVEES
jgi:hypothetical protein